MRRRKLKIIDRSLGTSPGSSNYVGREKNTDIRLIKTEYHADFQRDTQVKHLPNCTPSSDFKTWLNVDGIHNSDTVREIGKVYQLHPLLLEDVLNTLQKPKIDFFGEETIFIVLKWLTVENQEVEVEHLALVLGKNFLISFQEERQQDIFGPVLARLRAGAGKTRTLGSDYLLYALLDTVTDQYFRVLDILGEQLETLEEELTLHPNQKHLYALHSTRRTLLLVRKQAAPLREIATTLLRQVDEKGLIHPETGIYLRDLHDHALQVLDTLDTYRELNNSLLELYNSTVSYRLNEVMKVLTMISLVFIPPTFIAGVYGMNFEFMPELHWQCGYPMAWAIMGGFVIGMLIFFRRKGWL